MEKHNIGTVVLISAEFRDKAGALIDPTTAKITVIDPAGTNKVNAGDYVKDSTGKYHYYWQSEFADIAGKYRVKTVLETLVGAQSYRVVDITTLFEMV